MCVHVHAYKYPVEKLIKLLIKLCLHWFFFPLASQETASHCGCSQVGADPPHPEVKGHVAPAKDRPSPLRLRRHSWPRTAPAWCGSVCLCCPKASRNCTPWCACPRQRTCSCWRRGPAAAVTAPWSRPTKTTSRTQSNAGRKKKPRPRRLGLLRSRTLRLTLSPASPQPQTWACGRTPCPASPPTAPGSPSAGSRRPTSRCRRAVGRPWASSASPALWAPSLASPWSAGECCCCGIPPRCITASPKSTSRSDAGGRVQRQEPTGALTVLIDRRINSRLDVGWVMLHLCLDDSLLWAVPLFSPVIHRVKQLQLPVGLTLSCVCCLKMTNLYFDLKNFLFYWSNEWRPWL